MNCEQNHNCNCDGSCQRRGYDDISYKDRGKGKIFADVLPELKKLNTGFNNPEQDSYLMELRDRFALAAMQGILSSPLGRIHEDTKLTNERELSSVSYRIADAMLKQREVK